MNDTGIYLQEFKEIQYIYRVDVPEQNSRHIGTKQGRRTGTKHYMKYEYVQCMRRMMLKD